MASIINLEDLPQLVMEKITSFLNHKQLLTLEQVSRKLKSAVDSHFSITDHLIIGFLPEVQSTKYDEATAKEKKCLNGLLKIITRCGINLRTIQITITYKCADIYCTYGNYTTYFKHFLASCEMSSNCPNVENVIASPNMDLFNSHHDLFRKQQILLWEEDAEMYANNIKLSKGLTCKLRSIASSTDSHQRLLNLFPNIEQMFLNGDVEADFFEFLPQFIKNGLKDLFVYKTVNLLIANTYCNIGKNLRTLSLAIRFDKDDDISALNKLHLTKNVELRIRGIRNVDDCLKLNDNVCNSVNYCEVPSTLSDYSSMTKLKRLQEFDISNLGQLKVIAEGPFPALRIITNNNDDLCDYRNCDACDLQTFLPQLLINKGNHLTSIHIRYICGKAMDAVWKALKHCKAVKNVRFYNVVINSPLTVTAEDIKAICDLPNLQKFIFSIVTKNENETYSNFRKLMETTIAEHTGFQFLFTFFTFPWSQIIYELHRIHF